MTLRYNAGEVKLKEQILLIFNLDILMLQHHLEVILNQSNVALECIACNLSAGNRGVPTPLDPSV